jgi:radical SAM protein with 4Fe4S-binding SPASM domain
MIRLAKSHHLYTVCSSNGQRLADQEYARSLVESGLDDLILSVDGLTQETYALYRRGGSLQKIINGIGHLREWRSQLHRNTPRIQMQFVVMRHNEHELASAAATAREWGADRIIFKSPYIGNATDAADLLPNQPEFQRYRIVNGELQTRGKRRGPCQRLWYSMVIHWDGSVVPCCFDKNNHHVLGHATQPLADIWRSKAYTDFRARFLTHEWPLMCGNCTNGFSIYPS